MDVRGTATGPSQVGPPPGARVTGRMSCLRDPHAAHFFGNTKIDLLRRFLELPHGIASPDTFGRVFARLDPAALLSCIQQWLTARGL